MLTYDEILDNMKSAFFEKTGENVELMSDLGARFQAVASELFSLSCYSDFVLKQAFVQSATGEYLDYHAALRDMERKTAAKAYGELTFSLSEAAETDAEIPQGVICSAPDKPFIQFVTTESAVIEAGELSVTVPAEALEGGASYNAGANTVTVMVNPPSGVAFVNNENAFTGGWDDESDEGLRKRILSSYSVPPNGISPASIAESILKLDDVLDCNVTKYWSNYVNVYVKTKSNTLSPSLVNQIKDKMMMSQLARMNINVNLASCINYDITVNIKPTGGSSEAQDKVYSVIKEFADSVRISQSIDLKEIYSLILFNAPLSYCEIRSPQAMNGIINSAADSYLRLGTLTVICDE